jgi:metalloendopeptidase OMA1, mitochondrial
VSISLTQAACTPPNPLFRIPANVHFLVDDANEEYWGNHKFDFIHTRMLLGSFADFKAITKRSFDYLEPGGWMECQEVYTKLYCDDNTLTPDNKFGEWTGLQDEAAMMMVRPLRIANKLKKWYEDIGFVDVHEEVFKLPINSWPRDPQFKLIGKFWESSLADGLQGFSLAYFHRAFGWTKDEIEVYLVGVREAIKDKNVHAYHKL